MNARRNRGGFALVSVLVISFVLFYLLDLAVSTSYRLHEQNRRWAKELQERADRLSNP